LSDSTVRHAYQDEGDTLERSSRRARTLVTTRSDARHDALDTSNMSCRNVTWRVKLNLGYTIFTTSNNGLHINAALHLATLWLWFCL